MIHFTLDDREYEFDQNELDLNEAIILKVELGITIKDFTLGQETLDPHALKGMVFLAKRRAGQAVRMQDITFDCMKLIYSIRYKASPIEETEPANPTVVPLTPDGSDNGMTPANAELSISETSPSTSA